MSDHTKVLVVAFLGQLALALPLGVYSPRKLARSIPFRLFIHCWCVGLVVVALIYAASESLRWAMTVSACATAAQYWIFVALEQEFEARYGREPELTLVMRGSTIPIEPPDRLLSLALWVLIVLSVFLVFWAGMPG